MLAGCSVPFSLFFGSLFVTTLSCYTLDFVREGTAEGQKTERYCFDPAVGQCAPARILCTCGAQRVPAISALTFWATSQGALCLSTRATFFA